MSLQLSHTSETSLFGSDQSISSRSYPIILSEEEKKALAMSTDHLTKVVERTLQSPLEELGITHQEASLEVLVIQNAFNAAMNDYRAMAKNALEKDCKLIKTYDLEHVVDWAHNRVSHQLGRSWSWVLFPIVRVWASVYSKFVDAKIPGSTHRRALMYKIDILEQKRLKDTKDRITFRVGALFHDTQALLAEGEKDLEILKEMHQLNVLNDKLFPGNPLEVNGQNVSQFLEQLSTSTYMKEVEK